MGRSVATTALPLRLRQTHEGTQEGWHRWSLYLEAADGCQVLSPAGVTAVRFELHPTFKPSVYNITKPPFIVGPFKGWGTFDVKVAVQVESLPNVVWTLFPLSFERRETVVAIALSARVRKRAAWRLDIARCVKWY